MMSEQFEFLQRLSAETQILSTKTLKSDGHVIQNDLNKSYDANGQTQMAILHKTKCKKHIHIQSD